MPTTPQDNKILVRHGVKPLDIEWEEVRSLISSDRIFTDKLMWESTVPNTQYVALQRVGTKIDDVAYLPIQTKTHQDDLASIFDNTGDVHCFVCDGVDSLDINCIPSGFVDNTLDVIDTGVARGKDVDKGLKIIFTFLQPTKDIKIAEIKLRLIPSITLNFAEIPPIQISMATADIMSNEHSVIVSDPSLYTKYAEWTQNPPSLKSIVFNK